MLLRKEGKTYLYGIKERCLVVEDPIDGIVNMECAMVVKKGRDSALFSKNGYQLSDFKKSCFVVEYEDSSLTIIDKQNHTVYSYSELIKE